jgi:hypothetical protein
MSSEVFPRSRPTKRSPIVWLAPIQAVCAFTVLAAVSGGQILRGWILAALFALMALPLMTSVEGGLLAIVLFEPFRGLVRRAQFLVVDYSQFDPIHLLTPVVTMLALGRLLQSHRFQLFRGSPLAGPVSILAAIFILQIFNPLQGGIFVGLSGALLILVPVAWFYFGQAVSERFIRNAFKLIVVSGMIASLYGIYQLVYGYPQFEQYWLDHVEFYNAVAVGHVTRSIATFTSAEEWGRYTVMGALIAFGFGAVATRRLQRLAWFVCGTGLSVVLLLTGQRTAIFGLILGFMVLVLLGARNIQGMAARLIILLTPMLLVAVLAKPPSADDMWSKGDTETVGTLLSHTERGTLQPAGEESLYVRLKIWQHLATNVIPYRPLGAGLGAGSLSALKFSDGPQLPNSDNFVLVLAVACGIPGALLFVWILSRATLFALRASRRRPPSIGHGAISRIAGALMPMFVLNSIFGLTFSIYAVAPIAWLLIGWISAEEGRARVTEPGAVATGSKTQVEWQHPLASTTPAGLPGGDPGPLGVL